MADKLDKQEKEMRFYLVAFIGSSGGGDTNDRCNGGGGDGVD